MNHEVYRSMVEDLKKTRLKEPFSVEDFRRACPQWKEGTYGAFLYKHRKGNPGGKSELVEKVALGRFSLLRPLKHGLEL